MLSRRRFLQLSPALTAFDALAAPERGRARISGIRTMVLQGPRTYLLVKVSTDQGVHGIGEAYGSPAVGVREGIADLAGELTGKDPLDIETLSASLGSTDRATSGIEIALCDLAGKLLGVPVATLLGGRYRDRVRMIHAEGPKDQLTRDSCRDWADRMKASPAGWRVFKIAPQRPRPATRQLTALELRDIRQGIDNCRDVIGADYDLIVDGRGESDLPTALQLAEAVEPAKPLFLEDPLPPDFARGWIELCAASKTAIATGGQLARRHGFKSFILERGCDVVQMDVRNAGGLLESKKIADLADLFYLPCAVRNQGSIVATMASVHLAAAVRDFVAAETVCGLGNWMDDVILRDGPLVQNGHIAVPARPGLGIELNKEVVKQNLARGEKYWD